MKEYKSVIKIINKDLELFDNRLIDLFKSNDIVLKEKNNHIINSKGKKIRPVLVYLFSRLAGNPNEHTHQAALVLELLHTASLIHDDVVDNAILRRGNDTLNKKWDNKTAVLYGDYILSVCMEMISKQSNFKLLNIIAPVLVDLSYGELKQLYYNKKECSEKEYFNIIDKKTASLISACCISGYSSVNESSDIDSDISNLGRLIGRIFQISDDVIDYKSNGSSGKDYANDIVERKMTLTLIYALKNCPEKEKTEILKLWNSTNTDKTTLDKIVSFVKKYGESDTINKINDLVLEAENIILKIFENNKYRESLLLLIKNIAHRNK